MLLAFHDFVKPIADKLEQIQKNPETQIFLKNMAYWISNHERTSPFMEKIISEMKNNPNLSEAHHTLSYKQVFKLLSESEDLENTSLLDLINQSYFQESLLECFDKIEISNHFKKRKKIIEEAFKLYELKLYAGCSCLLHSQVEGIITDYLIFKNILKKDIKNGKTIFKLHSNEKETVHGLQPKLKLAKDINENFSRLEVFEFDNNSNIKFHNERNDLLHGSNIDNFTNERCLILFIWLDSIVGSIYKNESYINSLSRK